jgi:hypothetical protein
VRQQIILQRAHGLCHQFLDQRTRHRNLFGGLVLAAARGRGQLLTDPERTVRKESESFLSKILYGQASQ